MFEFMDERLKTLLLSSFILFSFSYIYDLPATLNENINYGTTHKACRLALLYSVYAFPNIIIPLLFRWTSSIDLPLISKILVFLVFLGQVTYSIGVYKINYKIMVLGRFVYGLGGESFSIIINRLISKEFKSNNLSFTLGVFSSIAKLGSILNFLSSPLIAQKIHRILPCVIGIILTALSLIGCLILNDVLYKQKRFSLLIAESNKRDCEPVKKSIKLKNENNLTNLNAEISRDESKNTKNIDFSQIFYQVDFNESPFKPWETVNNDYTSEVAEKLSKSDLQELQKIENTIFYEPSIKKAKSFHSTFIILAFISFLVAIVWAPFYSLAPILFKSQYNLNTLESGHLLSIVEILSLFLTPMIGILADRYGNKIYLMLIGCSLLLLSHLSLALHSLSPFIIVSILGTAGPLVNCYWPCIPSLVSENNLTNGFATIFCLLNLAFTLSPILIGFLLSKFESFKMAEYFIVGISSVVFLTTGFLIYLDKKFRLGLNQRTEKFKLSSSC